MKTLTNKLLTLSLFTFIFLLNSCSSYETVSVSETHLYNNHYGVHQNLHVDTIIHNELLAINKPTEVEKSYSSDPEWTTELKMDSDAFLAEDYVEKAPEITYKYKFDKKFYKTAEWRRAEF